MAAKRFRAEKTPVERVRVEAARRMMSLLGARDRAHLEILIANGTREAVRLQEMRIAHLVDPASNPGLTTEDARRVATLKGVDAAIEAIRAASNALEVMDPVPADYADDLRWP